MKIQPDFVVTLGYKVADATTKLIEESRESMVCLHDGCNMAKEIAHRHVHGEHGHHH